MIMKTKYIFKGFLAALFLSFMVSSCDGYDVGLINELMVDRSFSPIGLTAKVRNQTTVELNWTIRPNVDHYVVEFSADDAEFKTIYRTVKVTSAELPLQIVLEGETVYSIRVKAISSVGLDDSKWSVVQATTLSEQIFLTSIAGDIQATKATFRWVPNSNVTQIVINPGNITHAITPQEKINGIATVTGLTGQTSYNAELFNGSKKRGFKSFTTLVDIGNGILITPTDDLNAKIIAASSGDVLYLSPGNYTVFTGEITINKSIVLRGLYPYDKPLLHVKFTLNAGASNFSLIDLDLSSDVGTNSSVITIGGSTANYGDILIKGCSVHDFERSLIAGNITGSKVNSFTVDNSIVKNVNTNAGADFIDFRNTYVADVTLKNSTFNNCSAGRDFVRIDAASGLSGTGLTSTVLIDSCTLYNVSSTSAPKRILYVRFVNNASTVKNTLIAETTAIYSNQSNTAAPVFLNNYYFNAPSFMDAAINANKIDVAGTVANPQFLSAATGNFKIQNQTLIDNKIGDPRWR